MMFRTPQVYHFSKYVKYYALQFTEDISLVADAGDFLVVSNAGFQCIMSEEEFTAFYNDLQTVDDAEK